MKRTSIRKNGGVKVNDDPETVEDTPYIYNEFSRNTCKMNVSRVFVREHYTEKYL